MQTRSVSLERNGKTRASRSGKFAVGRSANPLCVPPGRDNGRAKRGHPALLWKVCKGTECKTSLSSGQGQWLGKTQASRSERFAGGLSANPLCAPPSWDSEPARRGLPALENLQQDGVQTLSVLWAGTVDGQGTGFLLWKVCSGAECKPSLCSSRRAQWPPSTTLLWEQKPSLAAMDRWAVRPALASACELVRQEGNSQANKLHPVP